MAAKKSRTAAANAARRKQGPTKATDYKNGRPITAGAKKKASGGGKKKSSKGTKEVTFAGGKSKGKMFYSKALGKHVTVPGASNVRSTGKGKSSAKSKRDYMKKDAAAKSKRLGSEISSLQRKKRMATSQTERASLAQKISQKSRQQRLNDGIASGTRSSTGKRLMRKTSSAKEGKRRRLNISGAESALKKKGLKLGRPTTDLKTGKTSYKVTNKRGKTTTLSSDAIKKIAIP